MFFTSGTSLRLASAAVVLSSVLLGPAATAGASTGCGEYSFGFEGTRLLNDGISNSAGPFSIELPAGTYTVTTESFDDHAAHPGQVTQTAEQWYVVLDSGYVSPLTSDVPDDGNYVSDTFADQVIEASSAITLHHRGEGNVNSVSPLCVGFTTVTPVEEVVVVEEVAVEPVPEIEEVVSEVVVEEPEVAGATVSAESGELSAAGTPEEVVEPVAVASPIEAEAAVDVEVKPQVQTAQAAQATEAVEQLALTGPTSITWVLVGGALSAFAVGGALLAEQRRRMI